MGRLLDATTGRRLLDEANGRQVLASDVSCHCCTQLPPAKQCSHCLVNTTPRAIDVTFFGLPKITCDTSPQSITADLSIFNTTLRAAQRQGDASLYCDYKFRPGSIDDWFSSYNGGPVPPKCSVLNYTSRLQFDLPQFDAGLRVSFPDFANVTVELEGYVNGGLFFFYQGIFSHPIGQTDCSLPRLLPAYNGNFGGVPFTSQGVMVPVP